VKYFSNSPAPSTPRSSNARKVVYCAGIARSVWVDGRMRDSFVSDEIEVVVVVIDEGEGSSLGSTKVPGCVFAGSLVLMAVVGAVEVRVGVVVRGSGTCLSRTWIESTTISQPKRSRPNF
jgi:hypothetical protein